MVPLLPYDVNPGICAGHQCAQETETSSKYVYGSDDDDDDAKYGRFG